jgi:hypothetical protein
VELLVREAGADEDRNFYSFQVGRVGDPPPAAQGMIELPPSQVFAGASRALYARGLHAHEPVLADAAGPGEVAVDVAEPFPGLLAARCGGRRAATLY